MTGYGSHAFRVGAAGFNLELRSVNSRHADVRVRLPWAAPSVEARLSKRAREAYQRGRLDLLIRSAPVDEEPSASGSPTERRMARGLAELQGICERLGLSETPRLRDVIAFLSVSGPADGSARQPPDGFAEAAEAALDVALAEWDTMRQQEGARMAAGVREILREAGEHVDRIEAIAAEQPGRLGDKLRQRVHQLLESLGESTDALDSARLSGEIALLADRADVTEEILRLRSHFEQFELVLGEASPHGRKLEFLLQEMHREINTTGSKAPDARMSARVVEVKAQFEKVREVIQNIE